MVLTIFTKKKHQISSFFQCENIHSENGNSKNVYLQYKRAKLCMKKKEIFLLYETLNHVIIVFKIAIITEGFQFNINFGLFRFVFKIVLLFALFQMTDFIHP